MKKLILALIFLSSLTIDFKNNAMHHAVYKLPPRFKKVAITFPKGEADRKKFLENAAIPKDFTNQQLTESQFGQGASMRTIYGITWEIPKSTKEKIKKIFDDMEKNPVISTIEFAYLPILK